MGGVGLYGAIVIGVVAGLVAARASHGHGLLTEIAVGLVGALIGTFLGGVMGVGFAGWISTLPFAVVGAVGLLVLARLAAAPGEP